MQKCSKFQFQSKILEKQIFFILLTIGLISIFPHAFAQDEFDDRLIEQQKIVFEIGKHSEIIVKHIIEIGAWEEGSSKVIKILPGEHSNLSVLDEDGYNLGFGYEGETFEESNYIILKQKLGGYDLIAEYTLDNFLEFDGEIWKKDLNYAHDVMVFVEEDVDFLFVNSRPIDMRNVNGINCMGCNLTLEFLENDSFYYIDIPDLKTSVGVFSNGKISNVDFSEVKKILNFDVEQKNQIFVLEIPFKLILNPFEVYFTEKNDGVLDQIDKIRKTEFSQDETHVFLSFRTSDEGVISILGADFDRHEKTLEKIEKMKESEVRTEIFDEKKGLALPLPGTKAAEELSKNIGMSEKDEQELSFVTELENYKEKNPLQNNLQENIIIFVIIGVIASVIVGVIIKLKR
tara:strand:- start:10996 stop:12201 length:1206 start_codon:yes stop_codon:yes gene_type:complete